jgi:hypothetical protein
MFLPIEEIPGNIDGLLLMWVELGGLLGKISFDRKKLEKRRRIHK